MRSIVAVAGTRARRRCVRQPRAGSTIDALGALAREVLLEEQELALRRHLGPVDDGDARLARAARPLRVRSRAARAARCAAPGSGRTSQRAHELAHHRQAENTSREHVVVRRPGRRLGVVLGEAQPPSRATKNASRRDVGARGREARDRTWTSVLLPVGQPELLEHRVVWRARRRCALRKARSTTRRALCSKRYCAGDRKRGRSTVHSGRSPKNEPARAQLLVELRAATPAPSSSVSRS